MNTTTAPVFSLPNDTPASARQLLSLLQRIRHGTLTIQCPDGSSQQFGSGEGMHGTLILRNWSPCAAALKSGDIGFAEAFMAGDWASPNLVDLLRVLVANRREMEDVIYGHWLGRLVYRVRHWMNRNTRSNSAKNIHAHYDLGNLFYELWLDPSMNYSSAWFDGNPQQSLVQAQQAKMARALRMAGVVPGASQRVLEIGCGWGAVAELGAREFTRTQFGHGAPTATNLQNALACAGHHTGHAQGSRHLGLLGLHQALLGVAIKPGRRIVHARVKPELIEQVA